MDREGEIRTRLMFVRVIAMVAIGARTEVNWQQNRMLRLRRHGHSVDITKARHLRANGRQKLILV